MSEPSLERGILQAFRRGLKNAVNEAEGVGWDDIDSIKQHKLLLMGVRNFPDVSDHVTIQWYLDGDMLPNLEEQSGPIQTNAGIEDGPIPQVEAIKQFYTEEMDEPIEEILTAETFSWLKRYYEQQEAPFKQTYLANMDIHLHITQCAQVCDPDHPDASLPEDLISPVQEASTALKREMIKYPLFRNLPPLVTEFERVSTQVLSWLEEQDAADIENCTEYMELLKHLDSFYYNGVWRPISHRIGYYTLRGPTKDDEREDHIADLKRARQNFLKLSTQFRSRANSHGISIDVRTDRIPTLRPEERDFQEILEWTPEDGATDPVTMV